MLNTSCQGTSDPIHAFYEETSGPGANTRTDQRQSTRVHESGKPVNLHCLSWIVKIVKKRVNSNLGGIQHLSRQGCCYNRYGENFRSAPFAVPASLYPIFPILPFFP